MANFNSLVPVVADAAVQVSRNITSLLVKSRANGVIQRAQFEMLMDQTAKVLAEARAYYAGDLVTINLEQIARTQEYIDSQEKLGRLHGISLNMAMDELGDLNDTLRRNLRDFENRWLR